MTTTSDTITRNRYGHDINTDDGWCYDCDDRECSAQPLACDGHPADEFSPMGVTVYCDGSCRG